MEFDDGLRLLEALLELSVLALEFGVAFSQRILRLYLAPALLRCEALELSILTLAPPDAQMR